MTQEGPSTPSRPAGPGGSDAWQPDAIARHQATQSAYLEQISVTSIGQDTAAYALQFLALVPGQAVLEVGCGNGVFLSALARAVGPTGRVVGIDHAPAFVAEARARVAAAGLAATVTIEEGDAYRLPFPDASFDGAHCERVLMHLADPTAALREMARVVRPGGWIVAAETDWAGIRVDHPDRAGFDLLYQRSLSQRQPDMGLTLHRRFAEVGLTDRRAALTSLITTDIATMRTVGLDLAPAAAALVAEGQLTCERADALLTYLQDASRGGYCFAYGVIPIVAGRQAPATTP